YIMKTLYYVAEREIESDGCMDYATDIKNITVYHIVNNEMVIFAEIESFVSSESEAEIQAYLDNSEINDEFNFQVL
ncbi:MAG TPA: hypothetical protein DCW93_02015, partial [Saprospirales bacterium]|nr:hypothetical protein [Saprospirales bacterium]